jgi:hypothetical protein
LEIKLLGKNALHHGVKEFGEGKQARPLVWKHFPGHMLLAKQKNRQAT